MGREEASEFNEVFHKYGTHSMNKKSDPAFAQVVKDEGSGEEKRYKCTFPECNAAFSKPSRLDRHIRLHTGERNHKCNHIGCDKAYTNSSHLKRHMETHVMIKKLYKCPECPLNIRGHIHNLKRHYNSVHKNGKLTCKECNAVFTKKYHLATHMTTHTGVLHKCDECNKSFTDFRKFKRHKENHKSEQKLYPCTVSGCSEVFGKWALLCAHRRTQHVNNYRCKDCDKVFLHKRHLRYHSQVHMKIRLLIPCPYDKCPRAYYSKGGLDAHIKIKHLEQKHECNICKIKLSTKQKLLEHIQKLHVLKNKIVETKKLQRRRRKDAGLLKKSAVSTLVGVKLPPELEKRVLTRGAKKVLLDEFEKVSNCNLNS
ncbi:zinc finger protein 320-like [Hylaeus anthracinus]|uniref:zinc finger protein 320-like n=1 Tax=Hylaeus volcanicus TaxID=313075 RepID=UPI0023B83DAF|nr:zinc finger protein 320-like [Hylaeus volcanicus]XP_053995219.1 zinc finger protein 320-like [Hylaeus anthracinus]